MSEITLENIFSRVETGYDACKRTLSTWGGHTVTFFDSGTLKPGIIGFAATVLSVAMVALALFLAVKAIGLALAGAGMILSGAGIAPGCALLGWSALSATVALTVGLLALVPLATALGAFEKAKMNLHNAFHPASDGAELA